VSVNGRTDLPKASFELLVREITQQGRGDVKFQTPAVRALKEAVEASFLKVMENGLISTARAAIARWLNI
jgi:histone H3/H4